jgi:tRNA(adenine34) deaminase
MHQKYFDEVVKLAQKAFLKNEVPIGAVVVDEHGTIIGRGYNQTIIKKDATQHAEMVALKQAQHKVGDWRLDNAILYVTVEPCLMCLGAGLVSRVKEVHFILEDPTFGSLRSIMEKKNIKGAYKNLKFVQHVEQRQEVGDLMTNFFKKLRKIK